MSEFKRESRYYVIKKSDIENAFESGDIPEHYLDYFDAVLQRVWLYRLLNNKKPLNTVVIEDDWPEYEEVWKMIENRVTNKENNNGSN